jgi:hypothetical protein
MIQACLEPQGVSLAIGGEDYLQEDNGCGLKHVAAFSLPDTADSGIQDDRTHEFMIYVVPTALSYLTFLRLSSIRERIASTSRLVTLLDVHASAPPRKTNGYSQTIQGKKR